MADQRTDELTEDTAPALDDLVYVEHDPGGTPSNRKLRIRNLSIPRMTAAQLPAAPAQGFAAYVTDNTLPTGAMIPDPTVRPPGPGLYVFDGSRYDPPWNLAWGILDYAQIVADSAAHSAETDIITGHAITLRAGRRVKLTAHVGHYGTTVASDVVILRIKEGATQLSSKNVRIIASAVADQGVDCAAVITPSAAAHTYKVTSARLSGSGNETAGASATEPAFLLVEDIGPAVAAPS